MRQRDDAEDDAIDRCVKSVFFLVQEGIAAGIGALEGALSYAILDKSCGSANKMVAAAAIGRAISFPLYKIAMVCTNNSKDDKATKGIKNLLKTIVWRAATSPATALLGASIIESSVSNMQNPECFVAAGSIGTLSMLALGSCCCISFGGAIYLLEEKTNNPIVRAATNRIRKSSPLPLPTSPNASPTNLNTSSTNKNNTKANKKCLPPSPDAVDIDLQLPERQDDTQKNRLLPA